MRKHPDDYYPITMTSNFLSLIERRTKIVERLWAVEDAAATMYLPEVFSAARVAVAEMRPLIEEWEATPETKEHLLETGKTLRYFADALSSLGGQENQAALQEASETYLHAERLLEAAGDGLEMGRLNFNYAHTLQNTAQGRNRALMEESRRRFNLARHVFAREKPAMVDQAETALQGLEAQLKLLGFYETAQQSHERVLGFSQSLEKAGPNDMATLNTVGEAIKEMKATEASPQEQVDQLRSFLERVGGFLPASGTDAEKQAARQKTRADLANLSNNLSDGERSTTDDEVAELFADLAEAEKRGEVSPERSASLRALLVQAQALVRESPKTPEEIVGRGVRVQTLLSDNKHIFVERQVRDGRASIVDGLFAQMRSFLMDEMNQPHRGVTEAKIGFELYTDSCQVRADVVAAKGDDTAVLAIEHDKLRPLAFRLRRFGLRHHLMVAEPMWGWPDVEVNPNAVFFAGSDRLRGLLGKLCEERRLQLTQESVGWGAGHVRWNRLRASAIGVFDLTMRSAAERASVCHALGSALALGVFPIVVVNANERTPFDIDLSPVNLPSDSESFEVLGNKLDEALFAIYSTSGASAIEDTARRVLDRVHRPDATSQVLAKRLAGRERFDPIDTEMTLSLLLSLNAPGKAALLNPVWPAFYTEPQARRCFHVMPFSQEWSNGARDCVLQACTAAGAVYRRGDETDEIQIVHSIWEEICRATHIVVDLTGLNANVCLELAFAQALGRQTLLLARDQWTVDNLFPEISKLQVRRYVDSDNGESLTEIVREFLMA